MSIVKTTNNGVTVLRFGPRLDSTNAAQMETGLAEAINGASLVLLDLAELEYISSAGLRVILSLAKAANGSSGKLTLCNAQEAVREVLVITGFDAMLGLHDGAAAAVAALG